MKASSSPFLVLSKEAEQENEARKKQEEVMREKQLAQEAKKLDAKVGGTKSWSGGQDKELKMQGAGSKKVHGKPRHRHTQTLSVSFSVSLPWNS